MQAKCRISGLSKRFGAADVVRQVSLEIAAGEFVVILGPSGCGKTTTLRMIAGLTAQDAGVVEIDGDVVSDPSRGVFVRPERRNVGMVFQSYAIWPHMTVLQNVAYPLRVRRTRRRLRRARAMAALELVGLAEQASRSATLLSGGQMQRVALARALVFDPALVLFDEPLSNLDLKLREELKSLQRRTGATSVYVTHDQTEAVELADRIVVMEAGRVMQVGSPQELYRAPRSRFVAEFISGANIIPGRVERVVGPGVARVMAEGVSVSARHDQPISPGELVQVVLHPEDCVLGAAGEFLVRVLHRRFQGTSTRYTVSWGGGASLEVTELGTASRFAEGAEAWVRIAPDAARVLPVSSA